jgi:hypothetical protein
MKPEEIFGTPELPTEAVKEPCNDCPWRRNAVQGWLGPHDANEWAEAAQSDSAIACHQTIRESESWEGTKQCRGASIFRANICKMSRDPRVVNSEADHERVFSSPQEFIEYHEGEEGLNDFYAKYPWLEPEKENTNGGTERQEFGAADDS